MPPEKPSTIITTHRLTADMNLPKVRIAFLIYWSDRGSGCYSRMSNIQEGIT